MLSELLGAFKNAQVGTSLLQVLLNLVQHLDEKLLNDLPTRNAVIDDVCASLQALKTPEQGQ